MLDHDSHLIEKGRGWLAGQILCGSNQASAQPMVMAMALNRL
jgi:hypothetical protein